MAAAIPPFICILLLVSLPTSEPRDFLSVRPQNQSVTEGGTATFTCHADFKVNCSTATISWIWRAAGKRKAVKLSRCGNVYNVSDVERYSVYLNSTDNGTIYTLVINNVTSADSGIYSCDGVSKYGVPISSRPAFLALTKETVCPIHRYPSIRGKTAKEGLVSGGAGEFRCDFELYSDSPTIRWLMKKADYRTIFINNTGRYTTSANQLIISPLMASDNGSQLRCTVAYTADCEQWSLWYQILVAPQAPPSNPSPSPSHVIVSSNPWNSSLLFAAIGSVLAVVILVAIIVGLVVYLKKIRDHPLVRRPNARLQHRSEGFPTLRPSSFIPITTRATPVYFRTIESGAG